MTRCSLHRWENCTVDTCRTERERYIDPYRTQPITIPSIDVPKGLGIDPAGDDLIAGGSGMSLGGAVL